MKVLPFWSTREKSGAVSPTFRFKAVLGLTEGAVVNALAVHAAPATRVNVNFMFVLVMWSGKLIAYELFNLVVW